MAANGRPFLGLGLRLRRRVFGRHPAGQWLVGLQCLLAFVWVDVVVVEHPSTKSYGSGLASDDQSMRWTEYQPEPH